MHEMSIAMGLLEQVLELAKRHGADRVEEIQVEMGVLRLVVPEALTAAFAIAAEGTPAAGAVLKMSETPLRAACNRCGRQYGADPGDFRCPGCGQADVQILAGNDIIFKSVAFAGGQEEANEDPGG